MHPKFNRIRIIKFQMKLKRKLVLGLKEVKLKFVDPKKNPRKDQRVKQRKQLKIVSLDFISLKDKFVISKKKKSHHKKKSRN